MDTSPVARNLAAYLKLYQMGARSYTLYWIIGGVVVGVIVAAGGAALVLHRKRRAKV